MAEEDNIATSHYHLQTRLLHDREHYQDGIVNPPVQHGSTLRAPDYLSYIGKKPWAGEHYGRYGLKTHRALEDAVADLEQAYGTLLASSGLQAVTLALMSFATPNTHILMSDNVYAPVKNYAEKFLQRFNITVRYFNPLIDADGLQQLLTEIGDVSILFMESPGTATFETHDIRPLAEMARQHGITSMMDNSWGAGIHCQPLTLGVDVSIISGTKYISGHSDLLLGTVSCGNQALYQQVKDTARQNGIYVAPDEAYLALRGIRTLALRIKQHAQQADALMAWLKTQEQVVRIASPTQSDWFGHESFKTYFQGACGLFGFYLRETDDKILNEFFKHATLFAIGSSWGGYESLMVPMKISRSASPHLAEFTGYSLIRIHAGLERVEDLTANLEQAFKQLRTT